MEKDNQTKGTCPKCNFVNDIGSPYCPNCGSNMNGENNSAINTANEFLGNFTNKLDSMTGGTGTVELRVRDLFSQVFKPHTRQEAENVFACGSVTTTPKIEDISRSWPKPWYFARVFLLLLISALASYILLFKFNVANMKPAYAIISAMVGPLPVMFFFFECNSPRNIDLMTVLKIFFLGGVLSLLITVLLGTFLPSGAGDLIPSMMTGLIEELGKFLATAYFIKELKDKRYILNGLLIGGAVGAGFAAFETAGYILQHGGDTAFIRAVLAVGGHVSWAGVTGAAIMIVLKKNNNVFNWNLIWSGESLRFLILVIVLHGLWDTDFFDNIAFEYIKWGALCLIMCLVIMIILNRGLKEVNELIHSNQKSPSLFLEESNS
jgi:RsiW-degrading membrane proteinase PrsW (M82 family)